MGDHYDRQGNRIDLMAWARLMEDDTYRRIAHDVVDGCEVSTVWLGLDYGYGVGRAAIFETMIFGGEHDQYQRRYATEARAIAEHGGIVRRLRLGVSPDSTD